ncbi:uncharacterized protein LY89DRAFT_679296 [Mollisia scopiformis]|uniref:Uncharacterized protein n=1 Tax=Mollisia scopiformis TaxID=149040 RepID=A0A194XWD8_MOLSC|nr:uncharacterized protein LY89DRAFT_679296 [Mollisia scopiformis]KUJ24042.1 hypothetical protein LY89DRAFT_679296 [Mollisia scopiformis]
MEERVEIPVSLQKVQSSLEPYIKPRHEASKVRQVLSSHLISQLDTSEARTLNRPLSLVNPTSTADPTPHGVRGLQREYLRCVRANLKAKNEYTAISKEHREGTAAEVGSLGVPTQSTGSSSMDVFLHLIMQQQKHERLGISQDYIDTLSQKPAANTEHLDPKVALKDVESLPKVPAEVLNNTASSSMTQGTNLKDLVDQLEKSVLRAKILLKKEQKLLAKVRSDSDMTSASPGDRMQALGLTRNALINWIEAEMEKAGDGSSETDGPENLSHDDGAKDYIAAQLASIQRQYGRYIEAREELIVSATGVSQLPTSESKEEAFGIAESWDDSRQSHTMQIVYPYLERMVFTANEQKAAIQQRSHLTISLAKQVKEASQGLDRLAEESHLLPAHPMPTSSLQRKGLEGPLSFNDELMHHEKPDSSDRARTWTFAAKASGNATKDIISDQLEAGGSAMEESQRWLSGLHQLLGYDDPSVGKEKAQKKDIWTVLDGSLGVIKGDVPESR